MLTRVLFDDVVLTRVSKAQAAIDGANGTDLLGQTVAVGWAFVKGKYASKSVANRGRAPPPRRD